MASKLSEDMAVVAIINPQLADNTTVSSSLVDMSRFQKLMFIVNIGATDTTVNAKLRQAQDSSGTAEEDITGKAIVALTGTDDNKQVIIEIDASELSDGFDHVSCDVIVGDGATGAHISCVGLAGHARYAPGSNNDLASVAEIVA